MAQRDFNNIYLGLQDSIHRLAAGITGSRDEAGDVVQELYERLWRRRTGIVERENPEGYILASARNLCLDRLRARGRIRHGELPKEIEAKGDRPDEGEIEGIVARLVAALPERQRTVMMLRDMECMEIEGIAQVTGLRPTAVRMSLSRARTTVKEKLEKIIGYGI